MQAKTLPVRFGPERSIGILYGSLVLSMIMSLTMFWISPARLEPSLSDRSGFLRLVLSPGAGAPAFEIPLCRRSFGVVQPGELLPPGDAHCDLAERDHLNLDADIIRTKRE